MNKKHLIKWSFGRVRDDWKYGLVHQHSIIVLFHQTDNFNVII